MEMDMSATAILSPAKNRPAAAEKAILYRMVMPEHACPWGLKSKDLLRPVLRRLPSQPGDGALE